MANPVTVSDLEARWRPLTPGEVGVAQALLDDAWAVLSVRLPNLVGDLEADPPAVAQSVVVAVVSAMVLRVMRNPDGKVSESIDDYTYRRSDAVADGSLYVTADELGLLSPTGSGNAFTIRPYGQAGYREPELWWPL